MSAFTNAFARASSVLAQTLNDGTCTYQGTSASGVEVPYMLERDVQLYDDDSPARIATTIEVQVSAIGDGRSRQGDRIVTAGRTWTVQQVIKDDGHWRTLEVT